MRRPAPDVVVRAPDAGELDELAAIAIRAGNRFREVEDPRIARCADDDAPSITTLRAALDAGHLLVAERGLVVGFAMLEVVDGHGHLEEVAVDPDAQGSGVGTAILDAVQEWAHDADLDGVSLTTFDEVPWNRPFYERRGYRVLAPTELTPGLIAKVDEEAAHGLVPELRVVMWRGPDPRGMGESS